MSDISPEDREMLIKTKLHGYMDEWWEGKQAERKKNQTTQKSDKTESEDSGTTSAKEKPKQSLLHSLLMGD